MKPDIEIVANWWFCSLKFSYTKDVIVTSTLISAAIAAPIGGLLLDSFLGLLTVVGRATLVGGPATLVAGVASSTKEKFLMPRLVESYKKILVIACEETSKWSLSNPRLDVDLTCLESAALEWVLQKRGMPIHVWIIALLQ